jgi:hypothetical protein
LAITATNDLGFEDWKECRKTIGRLDQILEDLRKYGFSIITGLLTAGAFLGKASTTDLSAAAVFVTVMVLVAALFSVDTYYQVLLSGAVERALDLEVQTNPPIRVTKHLSDNATKSGVSFIILALYIVLLATAEGMGLFAAKGPDWAWGWPRTWRPVLSVGLVIWGLWFAGSIMAGIVTICAHGKSGLKDLLPLIVVVIGSAAAVFLPTVLLRPFVADPPGVQHWIVAAGMFLALYIQYYWLYCAWQSGLYRHKQRTW